MSGGTQCLQDHLKNALGIFQHVVIPEANDAITLRLQKTCAPRIHFRPFVMLTAIKLNNELLLSADEIGDVWTNGKLATKFKPEERAIAKM